MMDKIVERIVEKIEVLLRRRKYLLLCIKSSQIYSSIIFKEVTWTFAFGPFTKVDTSFIPFTLKTQN